MIPRRQFLTISAAALAAVAVSTPVRANPTGTFEGRSRHSTSGGVSIETRGNQTVIRLHDDFVLDSGPDPVVGLGKDGAWDPASFAGDLANLKGGQEYVVPATVDAASYNEVYIWCRAADVPLGVAMLK